MKRLILFLCLSCTSAAIADGPLTPPSSGSGDMLSTNNLSDLANKPTSLTNLGGTTVGVNLFKATNPGAISYWRVNADNSVTAITTLTAAGFGLTNGAAIDGWGGKAMPGGTIADLSTAQAFTNKDMTGSGNTMSASLLSTGTVPDARFSSSGFPTAALVHKASDSLAIAPVTLYANSVTVLTAGTPADIATITIPAGITRWHIISGSSNVFYSETAAGTLAGASFSGFTAAAGGGTQVLAATAGPAASATLTSWASQSLGAVTTSSSLVIRQTANSANTGTMSFYVAIQPMP